MLEKDWRGAFKDLESVEGYDGNQFGPNCWWMDSKVIEYLSKLEELGAEIELNLEYWEGVRVHLPKVKGKCIDVLIFILTKEIAPNEVICSDDKRYLDLTWS